MRDWRAYVRSQLPRLGCSPDREREIIDEIAEQLQDIHDAAVRGGASPAEATPGRVPRCRTGPARPGSAGGRTSRLSAAAPVCVDGRGPAARRGRFGRALLEIPTLARHAIRPLRTQPLFTATTIATFALGIGATTLVYALVDTVLIAPLPYHQPERLAFVQQVVPEIAERYPIVGVNPRSFLAYQTSCRTTCDALAAMASDAATLTGEGEPQGLVGARVSPNIFEVLGIALARGRPLRKQKPRRDAMRSRSSRTDSGRGASAEMPTLSAVASPSMASRSR